MNTPEYNDDSYIDEEPTLVERWRCRCGDMPGRCPGVRNCPLNECEDEEDE